MDPLLQPLELQATVDAHDHLTVEHAPVRSVRAQRLHELGEVPRQRLLVATAEDHVVTVAEHDAAEPVPLRLVHEAPRDRVGGGDLGDSLREHRGDGGITGNLIARTCTGTDRRWRGAPPPVRSDTRSGIAGSRRLTLEVHDTGIRRHAVRPDPSHAHATIMPHGSGRARVPDSAARRGSRSLRARAARDLVRRG